MFYHMEMPLNASGDGPEMDESLVVTMSHEVWDENCFTVLRGFPSAVDAQLAADDLNRYWKFYGPNTNS